jgi:lysophospholipase L1-like esterase
MAAALGAYAGGAGLLALTFWRGWLGRPFAVPHLIYVERPLPHLLAGLAALFAGYVLQRGYRNDLRAWARLTGKGMMLAISAALSLGVAEIGYRVILRRAQKQNNLARLREARASGRSTRLRSATPLASIVELSVHDELGYELQPNLDKEFGHHRLRTNGEGLRADRNYVPGRLAGGVRILGIGDSGMFGWNCHQGQPYLDVLQQRLSARGTGPHFETINLAVPGYNTRLEVDSLKLKGLKYDPDIVIVGWCHNDYGPPFFKVNEGAFRSRDVSFLYALLFDRERLTDLVGGQVVQPHPTLETPANTQAAPAAPDAGEVKAALRELAQLRQRHGFQVLVFGPMDRRIAAICQELGLTYYNTLEKVDASRYPADWALHLMHPRPEGHAVLAEHLERELDRLGWLTPRN